MTKPKKKDDAAFRQWLSAWSQSIHKLQVVAGVQNTDVDYQDIVIRGNMPRLTTLLKDTVFTNLLAKTYGQLNAKVGNVGAQTAIRQFLINACWICKPGLNPVGGKNKYLKAAPGDLKKEWLDLHKASLKLAKQIEALSPSFGPDSQIYLEARLQAGNPVGYIYKRKAPYQSALPRQPTRRLSELLRCFASDIQEEAALISIEIETHRQKGGAQSGLHFAMDALASASIVLSVDVPAKPNFAIVNSVIATLLGPPLGFDSGTVKRRYSVAEKRKTRA